MTTMDIKGVSWVGDMYQRFEALCVEVDESHDTIYEDTVKYVENQMRTVGETVKNFYSGVMQDLMASSSLDSAKEKDAVVTVSHNDDAVLCKKQKLDKESESVDVASAQMGKSSVDAATAQKVVSDEQSVSEIIRSLSTDLAMMQFVPVKTHLNRRQEQDHQLKSLSTSCSKVSVEELIINRSQNERVDSLCGCEDNISNEASPVKLSQSNENEPEFSGDIMDGHVNVNSVKETQMKGTSVVDVSTELDDSVPSMKAAVGTTITNNIQDASIVDNEFVSETGDVKQGPLKLDESCVLVEKDDHFSKSTAENVRKSYKKKIREAFSVRGWSKNKKNPEQLAARYEEQCGQSLGSASMRHTEIQNSQTPESLESEWELL